MIGKNHSRTCKKNSCFVKFQDRPFDHSTRKLPVVFNVNKFVNKFCKLYLLFCKNLSILVIFCPTAVWQNNSRYRLLNILLNVTLDIFQFARWNKNKKKNEHTESKERKFEEKVWEKEFSFNIYIVAFAFLLWLAPKLAGRTSMLNIFIFFFHLKNFFLPPLFHAFVFFFFEYI